MLYQRKQQVNDILKDSQNQNNNNDKRVITTTTIEKITTQKKPIITTVKPSIISSTSTVIEKKEIQNERIITETSLSKSEIESSSSIDKKPSRFRIYLSSRYRGSKKNSVSSEEKDKIIAGQDIQNNIHTLNVRKTPDNMSRRNIVETKNETKQINYSYNNTNTNFVNSLNDKKTNISIIKEKENEKEINKSFNTEKIVISPNNKRFKQNMVPQNIVSPIKQYDDGNSLFDNKSSSEKKSKTTKVANNIITNSNTKTSKRIDLNANTSVDNIKYNISNSNYKQGTKSIYDNRSQNKSIDEKQKTSYYIRRSNLNTSSNSSNIISYKEVKNIVKKFSKVYDPDRNQKGILIKKTQITLPGASDEVFFNRGRVLSKMNKLSNILLAKKKKIEEENIYIRNSSKDRSKNKDSKSKSKKKDKKLLLFSLTMISSKGLNNKDKIILRSMRTEKGGVVDLAQEKRKKDRFKIKKAVKVAGGEKKIKISFKEKEKAAKIIQAWWKELKDIYNYKLSQIIKIQSIWKGGWVRRNIYDLLYLNYLYLSFCQKIEKVLTNKMTKDAFDKLKMKTNITKDNTKDNDNVNKTQKNENVTIYTSTYTKTNANNKTTTTNTNTNNIRTYISSSTNANTNNKPTVNTNTNTNANNIKTYISTNTYTNTNNKPINTNANTNNTKTYISSSTYTNTNNKPAINTNTNTNNTKTYTSTSTNVNKNETEKETKEVLNYNGKKVIKITKITESERIVSPVKKDKIIEKNKFKGLLKIIEGVNNYHKKQAFDVTKPKILKYLNILARIEILKNIVNKKITNNQYILKKVIYKWLAKATIRSSSPQEKSDNENEKENIFYSNIRGKLFFRRIENVKNKQKKILLRKYFYRYLKNVLILAKKEERQKLLDIYKEDTIEKMNETKYIKYNIYNSKINKFNKSTLPSSTYNKASNKLILLNNVTDNLEACKILEKYIWRKTHEDILGCFLIRIENQLIIEKLIKIIKMKEKMIKKIFKNYFDKWKRNTFIKGRSDLVSRMFIKIIKIIIENNQRKILSKRLYQWRRIVNILKGKDNIFLKSKNTYSFFDHIKKFINKKYANDFINRIKHINKKFYTINTMKKVIIKTNNKKNQILLKNAFNKWRNKVADYEIGILKGKLLLKIYDKYKVNKIKDLIKKKLYRWENNTIFIDKITNIVNKENITIFSRRNDINKIMITLKSVIRTINRKNNDIILRRYFNRWERNTRIKNINLKELENMIDNQKETTLKKILIKYGKLISKDKIRHYYFNRWAYITKRLKQIEFANCIQKFCQIHLKNKLIIDKWKKLYALLKNKNRNNNIKIILKLIKKYLSVKKLITALKKRNKDKILFINKLSLIQKKESPNPVMRKIVVRENNKNKKLLLKNALNIWRNKVADYEIGRLKGKLLLKIYDKYKDNKIKEVIKKKLNKWENNTIFIDKIKNRINEENVNIYTITNNKNKIIILLKSLIRNINRKNNDITLRKYFNKWKSNALINKNNINNKIQNIDVGKESLLKYNITINGKYFIDQLKDNKKNNILKKYLIKYGRPEEDILDSYFTKWAYTNKKLKQIDNANIIQRFCSTLLNNRAIINKWKKIYELIKNRRIKKDINDTIDLLKKISGMIKLNKSLTKLKNNFYKKFISIFITRINRIVTKKGKDKDISPNPVMKKIVVRENNKNKNLLMKNAFNVWRNKVADYEISVLKGKLLLKIYDKYKDNKIKDILKKILNKWENNTIFIDKIKNRINEENIDIFTRKYIEDKINITFKSVLRNINRKNNDRILRKYFNRWKKNVNDKNKNIDNAGKNVLKIIKKNSAKFFLDQLIDNKKDTTLKNVIIKHNRRPNDIDILNYYFSKWLYNTKKINQINNANIIQKFCQINLKKRKNMNDTINNWKKLYSLLKDRNNKDNIKDILNTLRYYKSITKLTKIIKGNNEKNIFDTLKNNITNETRTVILTETVDIIEKKNNNNLLQKYFTKWKNAIRDKNKKDENLTKMMNILEKKQIINTANDISNVSLISKLFNDIPRMRALNLLKKIKKQSIYNKLYKILALNLVDIKEDFHKVNKRPIIDKILKIYTYKILSNLFDKLEKKHKNRNYTIMEDFFIKLYDVNVKMNKYKYMKINRLERKPWLEKGFKLQISPKPKEIRDEKNNKVIVYRQLTPSLVKYINRIYTRRKEDIFDTIRFNKNGDKFCKLLKKFVKKTNIPDKEDLVDSLKYYVYIKITKVKSSDKFYNLIRKAIIRKILNISKTTGNLTRILHLIRLTKIHKKIAKDRWLQNLIRRWRFITFVKKMALKKMQLMYKDLHVTYLEMADTVLNDGSPMGPYEKRFLPDIKMDKYLFDFNDPLLINGSKPYEGTKRKFVFKPLNAQMEKEIKVIQEVETIDRTREINRTYYTNKDNNKINLIKDNDNIYNKTNLITDDINNIDNINIKSRIINDNIDNNDNINVKSRVINNNIDNIDNIDYINRKIIKDNFDNIDNINFNNKIINDNIDNIDKSNVPNLKETNITSYEKIERKYYDNKNNEKMPNINDKDKYKDGRFSLPNDRKNNIIGEERYSYKREVISSARGDDRGSLNREGGSSFKNDIKSSIKSEGNINKNDAKKVIKSEKREYKRDIKNYDIDDDIENGFGFNMGGRNSSKNKNEDAFGTGGGKVKKSTYIRRSDNSNDIKDKNNKNENVFVSSGGKVSKSTYIRRSENSSDKKDKNNKKEDNFGSGRGTMFKSTYVVSGNTNDIKDKNNKNENRYSYSSSSYTKGPGFKSYIYKKEKNI